MSEYREDFREFEREAYWSGWRIARIVLVLAVLVACFGFIGDALDLWSFKFWAPKVENAKREVFKSTQSYVDGKATYLARLRYEYQSADDGHKGALRMLILNEASTVDMDKLPPDLQGFVESLKGGR